MKKFLLTFLLGSIFFDASVQAGKPVFKEDLEKKRRELNEREEALLAQAASLASFKENTLAQEKLNLEKEKFALEKRELELEAREFELLEREERQNIFTSSEKMGMEEKDTSDNYKNLISAERKLLESITYKIATQTDLESKLLQAFEYDTNNKAYKEQQRLLTKTLEELTGKKDNLQKLNEIRGRVEALKEDLPKVQKNLREYSKLTLQEASDYMDAYKKDIKKLKENEEYLNSIVSTYQEEKEERERSREKQPKNRMSEGNEDDLISWTKELEAVEKKHKNFMDNNLTTAAMGLKPRIEDLRKKINDKGALKNQEQIEDLKKELKSTEEYFKKSNDSEEKKLLNEAQDILKARIQSLGGSVSSSEDESIEWGC